MDAVRALTRTSLVSLAVGFLALAIGLSGLVPGAWFTSHGLVLTLGCVLPGLAAMHAFTLQRLAGTTFDGPRAAMAANLWLAGALLTAFRPVGPGPLWAVAAIGTVLLVAGATLWAIQVMARAPKSGLTDMDKDPLTKGDDACLKHVHFAHRFLPLGLLVLLVASGFPDGNIWGARIFTAAVHILVIGYGLLSMYGLSHFWVPRLSGIPAIAGGAIKGELHTTLLGIVGVTVGFLIGHDTSVGRGFLVGLGPFVFLGFFVWMGVIGANIMKNKSPSNSVRPEFVYIPWIFSSVFWAVTAVLMGIFINALPEQMEHLRGALRFTHLHSGLLGGAIQLLLALVTRQLPMVQGMQPPRFDAKMKLSFYAFNAGIALAMFGRFASPTDTWLVAGFAVIAASLGLFVWAMAPFIKPRTPAVA